MPTLRQSAADSDDREGQKTICFERAAVPRCSRLAGVDHRVVEMRLRLRPSHALTTHSDARKASAPPAVVLGRMLVQYRVGGA